GCRWDSGETACRRGLLSRELDRHVLVALAFDDETLWRASLNRARVRRATDSPSAGEDQRIVWLCGDDGGPFCGDCRRWRLSGAGRRWRDLLWCKCGAGP